MTKSETMVGERTVRQRTVFASVVNDALNGRADAEDILGFFWCPDEAVRFAKSRGRDDAYLRLCEALIVGDDVTVGGESILVGGSYERALARDIALAKLASARLTPAEYGLLEILMCHRP